MLPGRPVAFDASGPSRGSYETYSRGHGETPPPRRKAYKHPREPQGMTIPLFIGGLGPPELLLIAGVLILLFGASKLPKLARSMGSATGEFKKGRQEVEEELEEIKEGPSATDGEPAATDEEPAVDRRGTGRDRRGTGRDRRGTGRRDRTGAGVRHRRARTRPRAVRGLTRLSARLLRLSFRSRYVRPARGRGKSL